MKSHPLRIRCDGKTETRQGLRDDAHRPLKGAQKQKKKLKPRKPVSLVAFGRHEKAEGIDAHYSLLWVRVEDRFVYTVISGFARLP